MRELDFPRFLTAKEPGDIVDIVWTFNDPAAVVTAASSTVSIVEGVDPAAATLLGTTSFAANTATQRVQNGVHGVTYKIKTAVTLQGGNRFTYTAILPVFAA
jgi:hypothetical protein